MPPENQYLLLTHYGFPFSAQKATIHQATTGAQAIIKDSGYQYQQLAGGYDLEIGHF